MSQRKIPTGWAVNGDRLCRTLEFSDFPSAISFMVDISFFCEKEDHHPEWKNVYSRVFIELTTHDEGGISEKDFILANHINSRFDKSG
jgi:4a-hydroxytetrahydrobiopterin dehydratase